VMAAASSEPAVTAQEHISLLATHGITGIDLGVTIDTVDYAAQDEDLLESIAGMRGILLCGGNQIRLVETLLHRGEESAVLRAIARAHAGGAPLIAASGAASALSGVMIAGGGSTDALRFGVSSDTGHRGLVIQEGIGLFAGGIVDQNLISGNRLGRLVVACAEESERFGIGIFEDSLVLATHAGTRLTAAGRQGFVLIEIDPGTTVLQNDSFIVNDIRLNVFAPGESVDLGSGEMRRGAASAVPTELLAGMLAELRRDAARLPAHRCLQMRVREHVGASALLDLECPRDEYD
jgi:cyanophycinase